MRTGSKQKLKYVIILEILRQETDADHPMQTNTLLKKLEEQGIECSRETLYRQLFGMYSGNEETVKLSFDKSLIDVVIDKFGESVELTPQSVGSVETEVDVQVSPQFNAWVNSFGNKMKVISPKKVVDKIKSALQSALEQYE